MVSSHQVVGGLVGYRRFDSFFLILLKICAMVLPYAVEPNPARAAKARFF
jgi:hypothetical protein